MTNHKETLSYVMNQAREAVVSARDLLKRDTPAEDDASNAISQLYSCVKHLKQQEIAAISKVHGNPILFSSRGIGLEVNCNCFVCGAALREGCANDYMHNLCVNVQAADIDDLQQWFQPSFIRINYYHRDTKFPRILIGACNTHLPNLEHLHRSTFYYGVIWRNQIKEARELIS